MHPVEIVTCCRRWCYPSHLCIMQKNRHLAGHREVGWFIQLSIKRPRAFPINCAVNSSTMWFLGSVLFFVLVGSSVSGTSDLKNIKAEPGDDVTLTCSAGNISKNVVFEWRRTDLQEDEYVFFYKDNKPFLDDQHESLRDRVSLNNSQMKDGDLSVVLKNVTMNDTGTYKCRVLKGSFKRSDSEAPPISIIRLSVDPPGDKGEQRGGDGEKKDEGEEEEKGMSKGYIAGIVVGVIFLLGVAATVLFWISKKKKGSNQSSRGSINQQNPEHDRLNFDFNAEKTKTTTDSAV